MTHHADAPVAPREPVRRRSFDEALESIGRPGTESGAVPATASGGPRSTAPALPELREAARAVPAAIWSGRLEGGRAVELSFGPDLRVELRQAAGGIELCIRTSPALARSATVDLPAFVRVLGGHGVVVSRAEVRGGSHGPAGGATPRLLRR
ncbi:MAG TPA: hypothetical protein VLT47_16045 [Anaeromyxobacteraceae bacterium]|nr:hypothetical protein [Anaeromyxobacteraceae bacterium]